MTSYQPFAIKKLFDIHPTKAYKLTNSKLFDIDGKNPVVTNTSENHGRAGFSNLPPTEKNIITFSDTGTKSPDTFFYQEGGFIGDPHVQGMYPYSEKWNRYSLLYLITLLKKKTVGNYDYSTKMTRVDILNMEVSLPIIAQDTIDFDFMETCIRELEEERIRELEEERIRELSAYLSISGLDSYELNSSEKDTIKQFQDNKVKYKVYKLGEGNERLFDISSPQKRFNANTVTFGGKYPYVVRSSLNNGIRGYITQDECYLNPAKTISFGQDTATIFYQEKPYFTGDKIKVMSYRDCELNPELACYLLTVMRKAFQNFAWGQSSFNENVLKNMEIRLPVDSNDNIDYTYITTFIKAQEKLSIKNVIDWKDKIINTSKKCI